MRCLTVALLITSSMAVSAMEEAPQPAPGRRPASLALPTPDPARYQGVARFPTNMVLPTVLRAALDMLGEDLRLPWDEPLHHGLKLDPVQVLVTGITGEAFSFVWLPREGQRPALAPGLYWPDPGTPYRRTLAAAGVKCEVLVRAGLAESEGREWPPDGPALRERVASCLADRGLPAIIAGIPEPDHLMLVTGYEDGGAVLTGWCGTGGDAEFLFDADKRVQARDWTESAQLVVLLNGRQARPTEAAVVRDALEQAVRLIRMSEFGPYRGSAATFEAWAQAFLSDDPPALRVPPATPLSVESRRRHLICPMTWDLMERTTYAEVFLRGAMLVMPAAAQELEAARGCMDDDTLPQVFLLTGEGDGPDSGWPGVDSPEARRAIAELLLPLKGKWLAMADHLAKALELAE